MGGTIKPEKMAGQLHLNLYPKRCVATQVHSKPGAFNRFVYLSTNLAGQILNRDELSRQVRVDTTTIQSWL
jgi:hypothetical protein